MLYTLGHALVHRLRVKLFDVTPRLRAQLRQPLAQLYFEVSLRVLRLFKNDNIDKLLYVPLCRGGLHKDIFSDLSWHDNQWSATALESLMPRVLHAGCVQDM